jgi:hypothetical protein
VGWDHSASADRPRPLIKRRNASVKKILKQEPAGRLADDSKRWIMTHRNGASNMRLG